MTRRHFLVRAALRSPGPRATSEPFEVRLTADGALADVALTAAGPSVTGSQVGATTDQGLLDLWGPPDDTDVLFARSLNDPALGWQRLDAVPDDRLDLLEGMVVYADAPSGGDDLAMLQAKAAAVPEGGRLQLRPGALYRISATWEPWLRNRTLQGCHAPRWQYRGGTPAGIKPLSGFTGTAILRIKDKEQHGQAADHDGGRIRDLALEGGNFGTGVVGLELQGLVRDWELEHIDVSNTVNSGFRTTSYTRADASVVYPRGLRGSRLSTYLARNHGFSFSNLTDAELVDLLVVQASQHGVLIDGGGESKLSGRAVFCGADGLHVQGSPTVGGWQFPAFSTDRNEHNGVKITATGSQPIQFGVLLTRRDGANAAAGGGGYAGLAVIGSAGNLVCPVSAPNVIQTVGVEDDGSGTDSPQYGVRASYAADLLVGGRLWGVTRAIQDDGNHGVPGFRTTSGASPTSGVRGAPVAAQGAPFSKEWHRAEVATSETTTATSYGDLTTAGPSVTIPDVPAGAILEIMAEVTMSTTSGTASVGLTETGGDFSGLDVLQTTSSSAERRRTVPNSSTGVTSTRGGTQLVPVDTGGTKTIKLVFKTSAGTATFSGRKLWVRVAT